jgi:hypothetical protein
MYHSIDAFSRVSMVATVCSELRLIEFFERIFGELDLCLEDQL